ncbi:unnamed protein product [Tilletia laevis]|uniref:Uncharacterized protein n=2 Tax=Tilletia TaxID=13289 RepID=A0A177UWH9_9BASI|nr:hypothetical protein CF336_g3830 [Tilletia laevis]KAE8259595.1 hypothetical protein A4X03_0g4050 [Tilletia caries]CAD6898273.1 unnamed protein product [Tilletia controversa]KAE8201515.1 hypothetical protein CF335_g3722 [Tilletia laevis]CAD6891900.1 unnamed protein product [Tilletia caries]
MASPNAPTEMSSLFANELRPLWSVAEMSPTCSSVPATDMTVSDSKEQPATTLGNRFGSRGKASRRASVALLAADPSNDLPVRFTMDPVLLKPAMQSCLKNPFRLSLPNCSSLAPFSTNQASAAASGLPYPSQSIVFPSEADTRAHAFAQQMAEQSKSLIGITSSQHAVHQHYDRSRERAAILESEDGRRASDPDVATNFETELFRWAEQEDILAQDSDRLFPSEFPRSVSGASSIGSCASNSPSDFDEGYRADVESPMIDRDQHRIGTRIHTQAGARNKLRARAMAGQGWAYLRAKQPSDTRSDTSTLVEDQWNQKGRNLEQASTVGSPGNEDEPLIKTPRFSLLTEVVPRIGSPTHDLQISLIPTFGSPAEEDEPLIKTPRFSLLTEVVPRIGSPTHECEINPIPCPTRLQSRRPSSMRLRNLPDATIWAPAEIEVNGKNLVGRNMKAAAVYDPRKDSATRTSLPGKVTSEANETATCDNGITAVASPSPMSGELMFDAGEVNPPPPTPLRGTRIRGPNRVRVATLNAMALKGYMMPDASAHEGTTMNAHSKQVGPGADLHAYEISTTG